MLKRWFIFKDFVILVYDVERILIVSSDDFNRAFGSIVSANYIDVYNDFALNKEVK